MMRTSAPFSSRCVAKLCRSVWTVTFLLRAAAKWAERHAACNTVGRAAGPRHGRGTSIAVAEPTANRCRESATTVGESMT